MGFIKNWLIKRAIRKIKKQSSSEAILDAELRKSALDYNKVLREAQKRNKLIEADRRSMRLQDEAKADFLDEFGEDSDEKEAFDLEKVIMEKFLLPKLMGSGAADNSILPTPKVSQIPNPLKNPDGTTTELLTKSPLKEEIQKEIDKLSDEQILELTKKFKKN